uniref:Uncharacterized protein n=1 Tax=viral metagenome TaxID=1070528 RepID=A0A6C0CZJ2_9ZZZZ
MEAFAQTPSTVSFQSPNKIIVDSEKKAKYIDSLWRKLIQLFFLCLCQLVFYTLVSCFMNWLFHYFNRAITSNWTRILITFLEIYIIYITFYFLRNVTEYFFGLIMLGISKLRRNSDHGGFDWTRKPKEITGTVLSFFVFMQFQTQLLSNIKLILNELFHTTPNENQ